MVLSVIFLGPKMTIFIDICPQSGLILSKNLTPAFISVMNSRILCIACVWMSISESVCVGEKLCVCVFV